MSRSPLAVHHWQVPTNEGDEVQVRLCDDLGEGEVPKVRAADEVRGMGR